MECGAFAGITESCCKFFEEFKGWQCINVEPVPHLYDMLVAHRPLSINIRAALTSPKLAERASILFKHAIHPELGQNFGNGSINHTPKHLQALRTRGCDFKTLSVRPITYSALVVEAGITELDLMVLDAEGHELECIEGMLECPVLQKVFCAEHGHLGGEIEKALQPLGYHLDSESHNNSFFVRKHRER
ncbi:FkbM family methyltransferase [Luminiphilus sp.]|nr:FkbM family methyltransferase [Luminiphilus sp.]